MKRLYACILTLSATVFGVSAQQPEGDSSPTYGLKLPAGYRDWKLISVAHEAGKNNDIRAILGNEIAVKAFIGGAEVLCEDHRFSSFDGAFHGFYDIAPQSDVARVCTAARESWLQRLLR